MKTVPALLATHLAGARTTLARCILTIRADGAVAGFTDNVVDLTFDLELALADATINAPVRIAGTGAVLYLAALGYSVTDIATTEALNVDNLELHGIIDSPSITEDDLYAGRWDYAYYVIFQVNYADLTQGCKVDRCGTFGEISLQRHVFVAELRGLMQAYSKIVGELTTPSCRADLGDARCKVDLTPYTVLGRVEGVDETGTVIFDSGRGEAGPGGGVAITAISVADPGVVTAPAHGFANGEVVVLHGINGPTFLNTVTIVRNPTTDTFELSASTVGFTAYSGSGGTATPLGSDSGYFDHGVMTFITGPNIGLSQEVKAYVPGQIQLQLPFPYPINVGTGGSPSDGDQYQLVAGCDKSRVTCRDRFNNIKNMRAEPFMPGLDQLSQIGRR